MTDSDIRSVFQDENFKQIEDVIDARKRLGQYNVYKHDNRFNIKCVYSTFMKPQEIVNRTVKFDEGSLILADKDAGFSGTKHTDSEITIVRVKCTGAAFKKKLNKWDMNDIAIPGDGTHLGESPSLVNLATLVTQNVQCEGADEYLVPLSSWDPFIKNEDLHLSCSDSNINEKFPVRVSYTDPNIPCRMENSSISNFQAETELDEAISQAVRRAGWAGKISKFWRQHWRKPKSPNEPESTEDGPSENVKF